MTNLLPRLHWHVWKAREYPSIHTHGRALERQGSLSPAKWREQLHVNLKNLLSHAALNVPYYRQTFEEVGLDLDSADLRGELPRIPLLTKRVLRRRQDELIAATADRQNLLRNASGGSTGTPVEFFQDDGYRSISAALTVYARRWWGIQPYDRMAVVWGADRDLPSQSWRERFYSFRSRTRWLDAFRLDDRVVDEFVAMLRTWRPPFLLGYASALAAFAERVSHGKLGEHRFRAVCSSAETLFPQQRKLMEEAFASPVYNFYGSREVSSLAAECPEQRRLHAISSWRYLEIVDDDGRPVPDGEVGHIVVTDLSNYAMPFIRYLNGDAGRIDPEPCPCGRPTPVLAELLGRSSDLIRTPSGQIIHGEFFTHLFYGRDEVEQFQVHQTALDHLVLRYVPRGEGAELAIDKTIVPRIRQHVGPGVVIEVEACEEIPVPPSGKRRFTISDLSGLRPHRTA